MNAEDGRSYASDPLSRQPADRRLGSRATRSAIWRNGRRRSTRLTQATGVGAQFGGKYFCHDVRVIRLPRHGASLPIGLGRVLLRRPSGQVGKITKRRDLSWNSLEMQSFEKYLPEIDRPNTWGVTSSRSTSTETDVRDPRLNSAKHPIKTRLSLTGTTDCCTGRSPTPRLRERLEAGLEPLPDYIKNHPVYYAGPAKTPGRLCPPVPSGRQRPDAWTPMSISSRRLRRLNGHVGKGQPLRAKYADACQAKHGGFYLGSIGGPAARLAQDCIKKVEVVEYRGTWHGSGLEASKSKIFLPSSSSTTRATTSSRN